MKTRLMIGGSIITALFAISATAAEPEHAHEGQPGAQHAGNPRAAAPHAAHAAAGHAARPAAPRNARQQAMQVHPEPHPGPQGYQRLTEPQGWNARPAAVNRGAYQHNFQAARSYKIGPYHRPAGWSSHRWAYGERLPRAYWAAQYVLADYWLFSLEVPPAGYEWVRDGADALLVDTRTGQILQVEYGVFA